VFAQEKGGDFLDWLAEQAYDQYRLKRETIRKQLTNEGNYVLLLDGLDEVAEEQREQCVEAINAFVQAYPCGLVVCSRIGDYEALQNELKVNHALVLQPLTNQQMEAFIAQGGGEQTTAMLSRMEADWQLRETLRSPLLLNLYPQAFNALESNFENEELSIEDSVETRRKTLFAAYPDFSPNY
jgi:hypothetical protein